MQPSVIVSDLETVPDLGGFAAANDLVGKSDVEVREAIGDKFPKHIYHSIVFSPIFTADSVTITVSREKDGKLRIVKAGWEDYKVAQPDEVRQLRASSQGVEGRILPRRQGRR
jgi:hypothetical protein